MRILSITAPTEPAEGAQGDGAEGAHNTHTKNDNTQGEPPTNIHPYTRYTRYTKLGKSPKSRIFINSNNKLKTKKIMITNFQTTDPCELAMLVDEFNFMTQGRTFASDEDRDQAITHYIDDYYTTGEWLA